MKGFVASCAGLLALAGMAQASIDGTWKPAYGAPIAVQGIGTSFGNSNLGQINWANGSELNAAFCFTDGTNLRFLFTGNLESNYNKFDLFFDTKAGGQNKLRGDNAGVDFGGLNRMGDDGSGNGLTFDSGFEPDYWIRVTGGDTGGGNYGFFANGAELLSGGGGFGDYLGGNNGQNGGLLSGGNNFLGLLAAINNSNTVGVGGGIGADPNALTAFTGIEISIPLASLGLSPGQSFLAAAFINGGGSDFLSNQVLGSLPPGTDHLGEPRNVNFNQFFGNQYFVVPAPGALALLGFGGLVGLRRRR